MIFIINTKKNPKLLADSPRIMGFLLSTFGMPELQQHVGICYHVAVGRPIFSIENPKKLNIP